MANGSLDVMQSVADADFGVEVKFDSVPTKKYQDEGVLVQQDSGDWVRFSLYSDGSKLWAFGASTVGNQSTQRMDRGVGGLVVVVAGVARGFDVVDVVFVERFVVVVGGFVLAVVDGGHGRGLCGG